MASSRGYVLNLKSLSQGKHQFEYKLDGHFFEQAESYNIIDGDLFASVEVERKGDVFNLNIALDGEVKVSCDRCLDELAVLIDEEYDLVVRFGESYEELSDDLLIVPLSEGVLDLGPLLYEYSELSIPIQCVHPDGECNPEMMKKMSEVLAVEVSDEDLEASSENYDSRWESLNKLLEQKNNLNK